MESTQAEPLAAALIEPNLLLGWLTELGLSSTVAWLEAHATLAAIAGIGALGLIALLAAFLIRRVVLRALARIALHSSAKWDDLLVEQKVFDRLSWILPWLLVHQLSGLVPHASEGLVAFLKRVSLCALVVVSIHALGAVLAAVNALYSAHPLVRHRPIKGYLQVVLIVAWIFGGVLIVAALIDRSPWLLLSGLGAMTAILLLVFRDTLLSLVAGVQLTTNDLIRVGDWIEMPQFGADGDVVDIGLHTVNVQNWDRTITVIPTHRFLEHSFKNWRGMSESGGRRIKRAFHLDTSSIRFLEPDEIERFGRFALLRDYIATKKAVLEAHNRAQVVEPGMIANARRLTNVGTLRAYVVAYLRQHPQVHQEMTFLIRQLAPGAEGLPLEIYVFCNDTRWAVYEGVQADIFDHVLSMVPEFGLRLFQNPSGHDLATLRRGPGAARERHAPALRNEVVTVSEPPGGPQLRPQR